MVDYARKCAAKIRAAVKPGKLLAHEVTPHGGTIDLSTADKQGNFAALSANKPKHAQTAALQSGRASPRSAAINFTRNTIDLNSTGRIPSSALPGSCG